MGSWLGKARIALASAAGKGKPRWFNVERRLDKKPEWLESWFFSLIEERENQNQHAPQIVRRPDLVGSGLHPENAAEMR
jgi:hypothetical protein